jgi:hypothetical protein
VPADLGKQQERGELGNHEYGRLRQALRTQRRSATVGAEALISTTSNRMSSSVPASRFAGQDAS